MTTTPKLKSPQTQRDRRSSPITDFRRGRSLLAFLGGLGMSLAPAPLNWWGLAWISLIPLWWVVFPLPASLPTRPGFYRRKQRALKWPLLLWSLAYHGISLSWITGLHPLTWMGIPWTGSIAIVAFAWAFITFWGVGSVFLWGYGLRWLDQRFNLSSRERILAGVALWCAIEAGRSLTPLDWTALSYTQSPGNLWILHLGQLSGNLTITAAIVAVNGLLAEAIQHYWGWSRRQTPSAAGEAMGAARLAVQKRQPEQADFSQNFSPMHLPAGSQLLFAALATLIISHGVGAVIYHQPLNDATNQALNIGIIQGNIPTRIKLSGEGKQRAIRNYTWGYKKLADQRVDAVLTPEGALPFDWAEKQPPALKQAIAQAQVPLWLGSFGQVTGSDGKLRPTQRLFALNANGQTISHYDKVKLVPLGESMPFEPILGQVIGRLSPLRSFLQPGSSKQIFESGFGRAAVSICYESAFPNLMHYQVKQGANLLITASNLDPYSPVLMAQHQAHDLMRAIEFDRWSIRATNTGYSSIINPHGQVVWQAPPHQLISHAGQIYRRDSKTLYTQFGNWLTPLLVLGFGLQLGWSRSR